MELPIEIALFGFMIALAIAVARLHNLFASAMLLGLFSLTSAGALTLMHAVDVAFTEAAVGAGISTVLILSTLALTDEEEAPRGPELAPLLVVLAVGGALVYGTLDMPLYGDPQAPIHHHVAPYYLTQSPREIDVPNIVTAVLASYRGYDTLGELAVIFTAGVAVVLLLRRSGASPSSTAMPAVVDTPDDPRPRHMAMREKVVLRVIGKILIPYVLLFALYTQFHGDFGPGGGFQAGVVFAAGFILYAMIFGLARLRQLVPDALVAYGFSAGLLLYAGVGVATLLLGGNYLDYSAFDPEHATHGQHLGILLIELGVGTTVAAVMLSIYYSFAGRRTPSEAGR